MIVIIVDDLNRSKKNLCLVFHMFKCAKNLISGATEKNKNKCATYKKRSKTRYNETLLYNET